MRIWFDILTPKQVMFFKPAVDILVSSDYEVLCTSRSYREAIELAKIRSMPLKIVGAHGGSQRYDKLRASAERVYQLADVVRTFEPDFAVTFSSPEAARVAFGLGIYHVGFNDSPHAEAVARLTVPLMNHLFCPWIIPLNSWVRFGIMREDITIYRALDPAAWIKRREIKNTDTSKEKDHGDENPGESNYEKNTYDYLLSYRYASKPVFERDRKTVLIRLEESKASYIADRKIKSRLALIDEVVKGIYQRANVIVLCRYEEQVEEVATRYDGRANILAEVVDGSSLLSKVDIFVGAGGTMTAEAALMGKVAISIAPVSFFVEEYLVKSGLVLKTDSPAEITEYINKCIVDNSLTLLQQKTAEKILGNMEDPVAKLVNHIKSSDLA